MKKSYKFYLIILFTIMLFGCSSIIGPSEKVEYLFNSYIRNDLSITSELDKYIDKQDLNESQKKKYKDIVLNEYSNLKYDIKKEVIKKNKATVTVNITVLNLYKSVKEAEAKLNTSPNEFYTNGIYDSTKFIDYKLDLMSKTTDTISYVIDIDLVKENNNWTILELGDENLEKIHGIYNYELEESTIK